MCDDDDGDDDNQKAFDISNDGGNTMIERERERGAHKANIQNFDSF